MKPKRHGEFHHSPVSSFCVIPELVSRLACGLNVQEMRILWVFLSTDEDEKNV